MVHISDEGNVQVVNKLWMWMEAHLLSLSAAYIHTAPMQSDTEWAFSQQASAQGLANLQGGGSANLEHLLQRESRSVSFCTPVLVCLGFFKLFISLIQTMVWAFICLHLIAWLIFYRLGPAENQTCLGELHSCLKRMLNNINKIKLLLKWLEKKTRLLRYLLLFNGAQL